MAINYAIKRNNNIYLVSDIKHISDKPLSTYHDYSVKKYRDDLICGASVNCRTSRAFFNLMDEWIIDLPEVINKEVIVTKIVNPFQKYLNEHSLIGDSTKMIISIYFVVKDKLYQMFSNFYVIEVSNYCSSGTHESVAFSIMNDQYKQDIKDYELIKLVSQYLTNSFHEIDKEFLVYRNFDKPRVLSEVIE